MSSPPPSTFRFDTAPTIASNRAPEQEGDVVENLHRYVRGGVWYLAVRDGVALIGYAIHQRGTEGVDHFYDGTMAFAFNGIRELCGALPDEVSWRKPPPDVHPYHRLFRQSNPAAQQVRLSAEPEIRWLAG